MMRNIFAAIALVLATGASAETPPDGLAGSSPREAGPGAFAGPEMRRPGLPPGFDGPGGPRGFGGPHHMPPPPSKAAHFHMRNGAAAIEVKCADDEPTKACVEAASQLMDKLSSMPERSAR